MAAASPVLRDVSLDDKYALESGRVYPHRRAGARPPADPAARSATRSPASTPPASSPAIAARRSARSTSRCGSAQKFLERAHIKFQPGRERGPRRDRDLGLAAGQPVPGARSTTACSRCGTARARASTAAATCSSTRTTPARRSTAACWCSPATTTARSPRRCRTSREHMFSAALIPVLYPSSVQEILDLGLHGWAMSRYSGCWVGFKCVADTVESSASVYIDPERTKIIVPDDFPLPPDGVSIRWPDGFLETEARMQDYKVYAALALLPRQPAQPHRHRFAEAAARHHHQRQELSRRAAGAGRPRHHRSRRRARSACASTRSR